MPVVIGTSKYDDQGLRSLNRGGVCDESDDANDRGKFAQATRIADEDASLSSLLLYRDPASDVVPAVCCSRAETSVFVFHLASEPGSASSLAAFG